MRTIIKVAAKIAWRTAIAVYRDFIGARPVHRSGVKCPECGSLNTELVRVGDRVTIMCHGCGRVILPE